MLSFGHSYSLPESRSSSVWALTWRSCTAPCTVRSSALSNDLIANHAPTVFLTTIPLVFEGIYSESLGISGLNYIALGIGLSGVSQISARLLDVVYMRLAKRNGGPGKPEYRLRKTNSTFLDRRRG